MLEFCTRARRCLILESAKKLSGCQQLGLAGFGEAITVTQAVTELLAAKRAGNRREVYVTSLRQYLTRFAVGRGQRPLCEVAVEEIEAFLSQFPGAYTRQTWLNRISTLFSFAVRRGYVAGNPCDRVERVTIDHKPPVILTVEQSRQLLAACPTVCRPWLILAMFAGIRPDGELLRLDWSRIDLETGTVRIDFPKVRSHRRIVPLEPVAVKLLAAHPLKTGMVAPSRSTLRRFKRRMRVVLGLERWPQDVLRHTAASYLLALHQDAGKVAAWLGNSVKILLSHYHEPVAAVAAGEFWTR